MPVLLGLAYLRGRAASRVTAQDGEHMTESDAPRVAWANARRQEVYLDDDVRAYHYARDDHDSVYGNGFKPVTRAVVVPTDHSQSYPVAHPLYLINANHDADREHFTREAFEHDASVPHSFMNRDSDRGIPSEHTRAVPVQPIFRAVFG